jgi:ABC-2 type transport system permease protein
MRHDHRPAFPWPLLRFWTLRTLPAWCFIGGVIFFFQIAVGGIVHDNEKVKVFLQFIEMMPAFIKTLLGGDALQVGNVSGLIAIGYQHPLVLLLYMLYAVGVPTGLLAGEVQRGTMELILSRQTTKTQVYLCAGLITLIGMFALVLVMFLGTVATATVYKFGQEVPLDLFYKMAINGGLMASAVGGIALLAAACFRRPTAVGLTVAYLVVMYFTSFIADWWPRMAWLQPTTLFHYVDGYEVFVLHIWPMGDMCVLTSVLVIATVLGGIMWHRRDLPL